ncbi:hypothetical protein ABAZ39_28705 (plasmid) [Azospirillum argentinense]|uniref:Uncharacterized protein n=1 Tax=Azospirillum argentinense TaxID=2970906 RepID=A0A060DPQ3_9PROT|nr:hypothetical protein ABAZ39_28705 [Azospirillum argentinense]EZQ03701.1 hypothetical protein ABAZ39_27565 [Azospirillum argentinense]
MSWMPNTAMEKGSHAVMGMGRRSWIVGSTVPDTARLQPIMTPAGMPMAMASTKPCATRMDENSTLLSQVPL